MIKAVLFDIDGTLIDSNELHVTAWAQIFAEAGHPVERDAIRSQIGKGGDNLVPTLLPSLPLATQKTLADGHGRLFKQLFLHQAQPFPEARALIERVHDAGQRVVLASSASKEELHHYVDLLEIGNLVYASTTIDDVETSKPAPDIFAVALKRAKAEPAEAIAVGDAPYDVQSAKQAGFGTIGLLSGGFSQGDLEQAGAVAIYRDVADLLARYDASPLAQ